MLCLFQGYVQIAPTNWTTDTSKQLHLRLAGIDHWSRYWPLVRGIDHWL